LAAAALVALAPAFSGCQIHASTYREYWKDGQKYPAEGQSEPEPVRAPKKNNLVLGIQKFRYADAETANREDVKNLGDAKDIGKDFAEALLDAKVFKDVHYPVRDQKIDVEIEPVLRVSLDKRRGSNFAKIFPGIVFPWIDGFGFNYDHAIELELRVRDPQRPDVICDTFKGSSALEAKRYPSIFWLAGIHASLFVLLIFETVSTDDAVCERLAEKDAQLVSREAIAWLAKEFAAGARACPQHPDVKANAGMNRCVVCGADLRYPILNRVNGVTKLAEAAPPPGAPVPTTPTAAEKH
ncbi:MAG TPA: hypothetical protein VHF22_13365, partial [Planctomycetota bacterium]|nr:hypothetical protein [Planctomycetota bacterium]